MTLYGSVAVKIKRNSIVASDKNHRPCLPLKPQEKS